MPRMSSLFPGDSQARGQPPHPGQAELPSLSWRPLSGLSVKMNVWERKRGVRTGLGPGHSGGSAHCPPQPSPDEPRSR